MPKELHEAMRWWVTRGVEVARRLVEDWGIVFGDLRVQAGPTRVLTPAAPLQEVDAVVLLFDRDGPAQCALLYEVQLRRDDAKRLRWAGYLGSAVAFFDAPALLCVVTIEGPVQEWARTALPDHAFPATRSRIVGPDDWDAWSRQHPDDPTFQLLAWLAGRRLDTLPAELLSHLASVDALDRESQRRYLGLLWAAADQLPPELKEVAMKHLEEPIARFPLHPQEFAWVKQGIEQGIERGIEQGIEQGRQQGIEQGRLQSLIALATSAMGEPAVQQLLAATPAEQQADRLMAVLQERLVG